MKCTVTVKNPTIKAAADKTIKVGATASVKPTVKPTSAKLTYASSDTAVATVNGSGVVTGVTAGTADIKVTATVGTKKLTATTKVTVENADVAEAQLSAVKQTASNAFTATFTADASKTVTKDDIKVAAADGSAELPVKSVEYSADGISATVTLFGNLKDATDYNVTCKDGAPVSFKASVGEVASIVVKTASAQVNVKTPIEFTLMDATGIDVTPAKEVDSHCIVNVTGTYSGAELNTPSEASITMTNEGDEAEVEVLYQSGVAGTESVTGKGTIKCVKAEAVTGTTLFKVTTDINSNSKCAKFYKDAPDSVVKVEEKATTNPIYFCVTDKTTGDVVSYDKYEAESSNEDVATVSVSKDSGKFMTFTVTGNIVGNVQINITATKNGAASYYTIPVMVKKEGVAVKMVASAKYTSMSDSPDADYTNPITAKFYDADGVEVTGPNVDYTVEITNATDAEKLAGILNTSTKTFVPQYAASAKTYSISVKGQDLRSDKIMPGIVNVRVSKLPADASTATGAAMSYQLEISKNSLDVVSDTSTTVRVAARCNGMFAGYVANNGQIAGGNIYATPATAISSVQVAARYGTEYYGDGSDTVALVSTKKAADQAAALTDLGASRTVTYETRKLVGGKYIVQKDNNSSLAKTGIWTVELMYTDVNSKKVVTTNTFSVKNSAFIPTVKVNKRTVDALTFADIQKVLKTNVDMNNDTSDYESVTGLVASDGTTYTTGAITATNTDGNKVLISEVAVTDGDWVVYVPVNTTFTVK